MFVNRVKGDLVLQVQPNMTVKEMIMKYCSKIVESPDKFGTSIFIAYEGKKIDPNSSALIGNLFKSKDELFVFYETEEDNSSLVKKNEQQKKKIRIRQYDSMNSKKSQSNSKNINYEKKEKKEQVKDTLEDMALLGSIEKQKIVHELKTTPNDFISIDECLKSNDEHFMILGILAKYLEKIGIVCSVERKNAMNEEDQQDANQLLQFIFNGYILKKKYILDFALSPKRIEQLINNEDQRDKFNENLKMELSKGLSIDKGELIIKEFEKSKDVYTVLLVFRSGLDKILTKDILDNILKKNKYDFKYFSNLQIAPIIETIRLNRSMLDSRGDNKDDSRWGYCELRGGEEYIPPVGWMRFGLRVFDKYDNGDNDWLSYDNRDGEWCIAYSGLSGFTKGYEQIENYEDAKHMGKKIGNGVFVWNDPKEMKDKIEVININGTNYKLGLMLRVKPDKIRVPKGVSNVWVVNGIADEIRPYGILLQKA